MTTVLTLSLYQILIISLILIVTFGLLNILTLKVQNNLNIKYVNKYPLVTEYFINKGLREQNIENNQEIHELNKRFDLTDAKIKELESIKQQINEIYKKVMENHRT